MGQTEVTAVHMTKGKDFSARFELELSYHPPGQAALWLEVSVELVDGKKAAVALLDHPGNLRHPAAWHASSMPHELIQTPLFHSPHTLAAGESLTFTYRVLVSSARFEVGFLDQQWRDFAGYTSATFIETEKKSD